MKSIYTILVSFFLLINGNSFGQSLAFIEVLNNAWGAPNYDLTVQAYIINTSSSTIRIKMRSEVLDSAVGSQNYFCLSLCYAPGITESPDFEQIEAGDTLKSFKGYYRPNGALDAAAIKYTFFNINNLTDSIQLVGHFAPSPAAIKTVENYRLQLFPNPADGVLQVNYMQKRIENSSIVIYNSLGQSIYSEKLADNSSNFNININTSNFINGVYFCSISEGGKLMKTERFMVVH